MKYCSNCGKEIKSKDIYCSNCGKKIEKETKEIQNEELNNIKINKRDIATQIILTVITCGLYSLYWIATITDDVNSLNDDYSTSGITVVLLSILTCGLYLIYWNYDMGRKLYNLGQSHSKDINDNSIIYMVLSIIKADFISLILMQSDLNKFENQIKQSSINKYRINITFLFIL